MLAAKIVPNLKCECGHQFKAFVRADDGWETPCPKCNSVVHESQRSHGQQRYYGNRRFAESEALSRCQGFHPDEVMKARAAMPKYQHCIRDDGRVVFSDRKEERGYCKALEAVERAMTDHN